MHRNPPRSLLKAVAPVLVAGSLALAASAAAAGFEPANPNPIPDSAFAPVSVPKGVAPGLGTPRFRAPRLTTGGLGRSGHLPAPASRSTGLVLGSDRILTTDILAGLAEGQPERPQPDVREANRIVVRIEQPRDDPPEAQGGTAGTSHVLRGAASWYCRAGVSPCTYTHPDGGGFDAYAAAGPKLRAAIGPGWRGRVVSVDGIRVKLIDWCQCYKGEPHEKLLDLYYDVFARTGSNVTIRW